MNPASRYLSFTVLPRRSFLQAAGLAFFSPAWAFASPADRPAANSSSCHVGQARCGIPHPARGAGTRNGRVSHFDLKRVQQLVEAQPSLARAAWDWGFGDWESALGAASHMGNRPIAEYLIGKGARPSLFSSAMLGHLDVVKAFVSSQPGVQRIRGPHSISLLAHAHAGGDAARPVFEFLQSLGDAGAESQIPLTQPDLDRILGDFPFGPGENDRIEVTVDKEIVTWTRHGTMGRPLFHLGDRVFYPWGAAAVRIRFNEEGSETRMTVNDPDVVLTALRRK